MGNKLFTTIPVAKVKRNTFNLSNQVSLTMSFNKLYPSRVMEVIPGDLISLNAEHFSRLQPMIAPVMNTMRISNHAFYVPLRTLNDHFAEFMFNNKTGDYSEVLPYARLDQMLLVLTELYQAYENDDSSATYEGLHPGKIDYLYNHILFLRYIGLPYDFTDFDKYPPYTLDNRYYGIADFYAQNYLNGNVAQIRCNLLPLFAYQKVWNEYYRDENLVEDIFDQYNHVVMLNYNDGFLPYTRLEEFAGDMTSYLFSSVDLSMLEAWPQFMQLRPRAWSHDRFTSALPFAQRGPDVSIPITLGDSPVKFDTSKNYGYLPTSEGKAGVLRKNRSGVDPNTAALSRIHPVTDQGFDQVRLTPRLGAAWDAGEQNQVSYDPGDTLYADNSDAAVSSTIRDFRRALRLQQWYENSARGGYRPNEATLAHFGVSIPDASLQRAEFLGGCTSPLVVSEVPQTSESATTPQGTLAGKATSYSANHLFKHFFTEHGFIVVFTSCLCRANYFQGLDKMFSRMTRDEYAWPEFANLGEEAVFEKELFAQSTSVKEDDVFGYVPRYSDYKSAVNKLLGNFTTTLKFWVQPREFSKSAPPQLNEQFIYDSAPLDPFAVQDGSDVILSTINFGVKASRLLPFYGTPTL